VTSLTPDELRIVPLGGLGAIGMNCLALEHSSGIVVVDCGSSFPNDDHGVDVIRPDFTYLVERRDRVRGLFLTHGHEDHIGAIPYLLREMRLPIWASRHALGLVRRRLAEHPIDASTLDFRIARPKERYSVGPFEIEPVHVAHSIVEATALVLRSSAGTVVHTGDFDFDPDPPDGEPTDEERLAEVGRQGVRLLLSDSTNVDTPAPAGSERGVGSAIERHVSDATGLVVVALFASNVQRLMLLGEIARRSGRKICLLGRSLSGQVEVARGIGRLCWPSNLTVSVEQVRDLPRQSVLVLAGGTQGEAASALYRLAHGTHRWVEIEPGDTILFSSRTIPGNELAVHDLVCSLLRLGARVYDRLSDPQLHKSGHASRAEQQRMLELLRPDSFIPIHGTLHHLMKHADVAASAGVKHCQVVENGSTVRLHSDGLEIAGAVPSGRVCVELGGKDLPREILDERRQIGRRGIVLVSLVMDRRGRLVGPARITAKGLPAYQGAGAEERNLAREVARAFESARRHGLSFEEGVRRAVRRSIIDITGCRACIEVHTHQLDE